MKRQRYNQIRGLEDAHGNWQESQDEMATIAVKYFSNLFRSYRPSQLEHIVNCMESRVTTEDNLMMDAPMTDREIREAAFQTPLRRLQVRMAYPGVSTMTTGRWCGRM
ncbi:hypothetical protein PS2_043166 [Malus domestica]